MIRLYVRNLKSEVIDTIPINFMGYGKQEKINETKEVNEFFNPFKRKKNDDEHYIKVKKWMGKTNVKLISKLEPKNVNGVVSFTIDKMEDNGKIESIGEIRLIYSGREKAKELENGHMLQLSDFEQDRLLKKYFGGTISRGNK